jgi:hypothetical protein
MLPVTTLGIYLMYTGNIKKIEEQKEGEVEKSYEPIG